MFSQFLGVLLYPFASQEDGSQSVEREGECLAPRETSWEEERRKQKRVRRWRTTSTSGDVSLGEQ